MKVVLICSAVLRFNTVMKKDVVKANLYYKQEVIFMVLHSTKSFLVRLIEELEKLQTLMIAPEIVRGMFEIA
jgi:hypothetical protein